MVIINDPDIIEYVRSHCNIRQPLESVGFEYLAEGAANVVFTLCFIDQDLNKYNGSLVLRLRKDLSFTVPTAQAQQDFESRIKPLFSPTFELLLTPQLLRLNEFTVQSLNEGLRGLEKSGKRPSNRSNVYLPAFEVESHALILLNLNHGSDVSIEFKPKWLVQSPSAPIGAQRCRTCALNVMRRQSGVKAGRGDSGFCPFSLLSSDKQVVEKALASIWSQRDSFSSFITDFQLIVQPALRSLQKLQLDHNEVGLNDFEQPEGKDFSIAMALRDCSFFVRVAYVSGLSDRVHIDGVKILDLDLKSSGGGKLAKWADIERELISGGWYVEDIDTDIHCAMPIRYDQP